jgi:hypothetical protein
VRDVYKARWDYPCTTCRLQPPSRWHLSLSVTMSLVATWDHTCLCSPKHQLQACSDTLSSRNGMYSWSFRGDENAFSFICLTELLHIWTTERTMRTMIAAISQFTQSSCHFWSFSWPQTRWTLDSPCPWPGVRSLACCELASLLVKVIRTSSTQSMQPIMSSTEGISSLQYDVRPEKVPHE